MYIYIYMSVCVCVYLETEFGTPHHHFTMKVAKRRDFFQICGLHPSDGPWSGRYRVFSYIIYGQYWVETMQFFHHTQVVNFVFGMFGFVWCIGEKKHLKIYVCRVPRNLSHFHWSKLDMVIPNHWFCQWFLNINPTNESQFVSRSRIRHSQIEIAGDEQN